MRRFITIFALALAATAAHAAGTLKPVDAAYQPIQIKSHHLAVVINNGWARSEVTQVFSNPNDKDLEAVYTFPVPKSASLSEMTIWNGERELSGEVVEAKEARRVYEEERDAGNDAGIAEKNSYQNFSFAVSPVKAKADIKVRFVYYQPLPIDTGIGRYVYPLEEGGTDDPRAAQFWTRNAKVEEHFTVDVELKSEWPVDDVRVPGAVQDASITKLDAGHYKVAIDREGAELGKDFVLYYRLAENLPGRVELVTYKPDANKPGTFMLVVTPGMDLQPIKHGADYTFVLDVSGSMESKLHTLAEGVAKTLGQMKTGDRFRIVTFSDHARELTNGFIDANPQSVAEWTETVGKLRTESGTNVYQGLQKGLDTLNADRATSIILITDGVANEGIVDPKEFRALLKKYDVRVFGFLMGNSANWPLMRTIAEASGGFYQGVSNDDDIVGQIMLAKSKITSECLHDATLKISGVETTDKTDEVLGKVYRGQQLVVFGRYKQGGTANVMLAAKLTGADHTYNAKFDFPNVDASNPELERLWALDRIEDTETKINAGQLAEEEGKSAITNLGLQYELVTDYTSMVVLSDGDFLKHGIERNNQKRVAAERTAQAARVNQPAVTRRVDAQQPMFGNGGGRSHSLGGGGAIDPISGTIALTLAAAAWAARQKKKDGES
jgi:Ca-activated chloride channel family protein